MISIIILEAGITVGILIYWFYLTHQKNQQQKLSALLILERMENEKVSKSEKITHFLQNKMNFPAQATPQSVQFLLAQESMLLKEIIQISSIDANQALQIYNKLQDLLVSYYQAQQVALVADKNLPAQPAPAQPAPAQPAPAQPAPAQTAQTKTTVFKNVELSAEEVESIELCQGKFMGYLERKGLITEEVRAKIHAMEHTLEKEDKPA